MTMRIRSRFVLALCCSLPLAACSEKGPGEPDPEPRIVTISLDSPNSDDRALMFRLAPGWAPATFEIIPEDVRLFSAADGTGGTRVALFGPLADGPLLRFELAEIPPQDEEPIELIEVAGPGGVLRDPIAAYDVAVTLSEE